MEFTPPTRIPAARRPTETNVSSAIQFLFDNLSELHRLRDCARFLLEGIGRAAEGHDPDDLLSEAVTRTLEGTRTWNQTSVDIFGHLLGVMKSISSHWAESVSKRGASTYTESEVTRVLSDGKSVNELEQHKSSRPGPDRVLEAGQQLLLLENAFKEDREVTELIEALKAEFTGPEIRTLLGISPTEYETRMKRLRRKARTLSEGRGGGHD